MEPRRIGVSNPTSSSASVLRCDSVLAALQRLGTGFVTHPTDIECERATNQFRVRVARVVAANARVGGDGGASRGHLAGASLRTSSVPVVELSRSFPMQTGGAAARCCSRAKAPATVEELELLLVGRLPEVFGQLALLMRTLLKPAWWVRGPTGTRGTIRRPWRAV